MLRMGSCVRFCCHNILFLRTFPLVSALLANQKLIFDERISCITRHDDFSPRSDRTVSLQVAPFLAKAKAIVVEPVKWKTSDFIDIKLGILI